MQSRDIARLFLLASIWGFSFIFLRILSPVLGPILTADLRMSIAGLALVAWLQFTRTSLNLKQDWRRYFYVGMLNAGIPFVLFSFAALHLPAGYSAVLNASVPLLSAIFSAIWLSEMLTLRKLTGMLIGCCGVVLISRVGTVNNDPLFGMAILACLGATTCYALSGIYLKKFASDMTPMSITCGSQLVAGIALAPLALATAPAHITLTPLIILSVLGISLICSALAYLLFYRIMADCGPTNAFMVTFIVPVFGMLWGWVFLSEPITPPMIGGCALVLLGTALVIRKNKQIAA